ncbi:hypothetical protein [Tenebrionicola larvae]|uniref:Uncharacterized protein n=1 Tax=Tenebrionicola larvae TaxID=2815733 RepID=A0A949Q7D9_9ENTR|nr:hypothetical protein [Tenebrionicola larvae]MBV5096269.1 hypothetical protein [Tenebrionicola larvae]
MLATPNLSAAYPTNHDSGWLYNDGRTDPIGDIVEDWGEAASLCVASDPHYTVGPFTTTGIGASTWLMINSVLAVWPSGRLAVSRKR